MPWLLLRSVGRELTPNVFQLGALTLVLVLVSGTVLYVVHGLRAADRAEIESLATVADHNAEQVRRERASAARYAAIAQEAGEQRSARERSLQRQLDALRAAQEATPNETNDADPDGAVCPVHCELRWRPQDGGGGGALGVPADTAPDGVRPVGVPGD